MSKKSAPSPVTALAEITHRSIDWVYQHSHPDSFDPLPVVRIGRRLLFDPGDLQTFIESHKVAPIAKLPRGDGNARDWRVRTMSRKRYQAGTVVRRGRKTKYWEGSWRGYDRESSKPIRCSVKLGNVSDMSFREAKQELNKRLSQINEPDHQPESRITVKDFWERKYQELVFPSRKYSTKKDVVYSFEHYFLPELGERQLRNCTLEVLQIFFNRLARTRKFA